MPRKQVNITMADDPNDATRVTLTVDGESISLDRDWFFDGQLDLEAVRKNLAIAKQINGLGHIATDAFRSGINGRGGIECTDRRRYLVSVQFLSEGVYQVNFGQTVDVEEIGFQIGEFDLDSDDELADLSHVAKNVKSFLRVTGRTAWDADTLAAVNARQFWR